MSLLSPRLQLRVAQKQILTPGLVQMVTVLQLNRLELKEMIAQEIALNPVLEESAEGIEELTQEEVQQILERERGSNPADGEILQAVSEAANGAVDVAETFEPADAAPVDAGPVEYTSDVPAAEGDVKKEADPFEEIDSMAPGIPSGAGFGLVAMAVALIVAFDALNWNDCR